MGEVNPLKKKSWTYSLNITFTPVGKVCESHKVLMVQKKKHDPCFGKWVGTWLIQRQFKQKYYEEQL